MTIVFRAKTNEAYIVKIIAELLSNNIKTGCFVIDETGIFLRMMDHNRKLLIDIELKADGFIIYKLSTKKLHLGINITHFHRMLKSIKKKDSIELYIDDANIADLCMKVIPKENNRVTLSSVKIQSIQNLEIPLPETTTKPIFVPSAELQKMLKDFGTIGSALTISSDKNKILFSCNAGGIIKRAVEFGEADADDGDKSSTVYQEDFNTEQLCRISKLSGLSNNVQIYCDKPLRLSSNVGSLGKISIYVKSKEQIELEQCSMESETYDSD
jgi:proliferating cell nuclear antigen PCNA